MDKKIFILFLYACLFSQNDNIPILDIIVEGNQRLSQQDILRNARLFKGMTIKGPEIQQAIKRLWKLKRFGNIQILVDDETDEGLYLRIVVEEYPVLGEIEFEGNKKKSKRALKKSWIYKQVKFYQIIQCLNPWKKLEHYMLRNIIIM